MLAWTGLALGTGELTAATATAGTGPVPPARAAEFAARFALELSSVACVAHAASGGGGICCLSSSALLCSEVDCIFLGLFPWRLLD